MRRGEEVLHLELWRRGYMAYTEATWSRFLRGLCRSTGWTEISKLLLRDHLSPAHSGALNGRSQLIHTDKELAVCGEQVFGTEDQISSEKQRLMCAVLITCCVPSSVRLPFAGDIGFILSQPCVG